MPPTGKVLPPKNPETEDVCADFSRKLVSASTGKWKETNLTVNGGRLPQDNLEIGVGTEMQEETANVEQPIEKAGGDATGTGEGDMGTGVTAVVAVDGASTEAT